MGFWGEADWKRARSSAGPEIVVGLEDRYLKDGCYRLQIGREIMMSVGPANNEESRRRLSDGENFSIKPGQFAHLITTEEIHMPDNAIGLINIATGTKVRGLVNVSGFHVDAGYRGRLIFTVFNAGAASINLNQGQRLFRMWLMDYAGVPTQKSMGYTEIPREWADNLVGAFPSSFALATRVENLERNVALIQGNQTRALITYGLVALIMIPLIVTVVAALLSDWITVSAIPALKGIIQAWQDHQI